MIEYLATSVSFTPIALGWRQVLAKLGADFAASFGVFQGPSKGRWLWVDPTQHIINRVRWFEDISHPQPPPRPAGDEVWLSADFSLRFGQDQHPVDARLRIEEGQKTCVELWFPTSLYLDVYRRDIDLKEFNPEVKADLVRLIVGTANLLGADGFAYRAAKEDSQHGPPSPAELLDYLDANKVWSLPKRELLIAGLAVAQVPTDCFEADENDPPWHYRRSHFYLFDRLWPHE